MQRSFSALDLVTIPRSSAGLAIALGSALLTKAQAEPALPPVFVRPLQRLAQQQQALCAAHQAQLDEPADDAAATGEADQQLDASWSGFHGFLGSNTKLLASPAGVERGARARAVLDGVFADGLRFVKLPYREQWAESKRRLAKLGEAPTAEHVKALGGEPFVAVIAAAHERYGEVLHLTKPKAKAASQVKVREALEGMLAAVRSYVLRVANYLDENEDDSVAQQVGYALLAPLATWKSSGGGRKAPPAGDSNGGDAGEGEPGDEPDGGSDAPDGTGDEPDGVGDEPDGTGDEPDDASGG